MSLKPPAAVGMAFADVDTPALVIDLDAFERNLERMADFVAQGRRPAAAACQDAQVARSSPPSRSRSARWASAARRCRKPRRWSRAASATCWSPTKSPARRKLARLAALARRATHRRVRRRLRQRRGDRRRPRQRAGVTLDVLVEIDVGGQRCGIAPGVPAARLAKQIAGSPHLRFAGLQAYHGRRSTCARPDERRDQIARAVAMVAGNAARPAARPGSRRAIVGGARHRHLRDRGGERRLQRAAGGLLHLHGRRLRAQQARRRRPVRRLRARAVRPARR